MSRYLILTIALLSASSYAADDSCTKISGLAGAAMQARQEGALLQEALKSAGDGSKFANAMILRAYKYPLAEGKQQKAAAVTEFRNEAYSECFQMNP